MKVGEGEGEELGGYQQTAESGRRYQRGRQAQTG